MGLLSKPIKTLDDLFVHTLQDIYYAEQQITKALPKMIGKVQDAQLKQALQSHLAETKNQITRVEQVFAIFPRCNAPSKRTAANDYVHSPGRLQGT